MDGPVCHNFLECTIFFTQIQSTSVWFWPFIFMFQEARLPTITTIYVPKGYEWKEITEYIMKNHGIEVSGGLGPSAGKVNNLWGWK